MTARRAVERPKAPNAPKALDARAWAALVVVYVVWGSTYLAIRYVVESMPPLVSAAARFLTAGLVLLAGLAALRGRAALRASPAQLATAALAGVLLLFGGNGLVTISELRLPSGLAALLIACVPLWIVVLRVVLRDRPAPLTAFGVLLGFGGVALLFLPGAGGGGAEPGYAALLVLAGLLWASGSLLMTRWPVPADPLLLTAVQMLAGGGVMLVTGVLRGELAGFALATVSTRSWLGLGYLVVFGSLVAFTAYVWLLGRAPVSVVSTYAYVNPAVAVLLGVVLGGERLSGIVLTGGAVVVAAVAIVVTGQGRERRTASASTGRRREAADELAA